MTDIQMNDSKFSTLPNQLSLLRIILSPIFIFCLISDDALARQISLIIFFIAALTDWYDGEIARRYGKISAMGKFLDPLADKVLTSAAFIAFAFLQLMPWWMVIVIVVRDIGITILRSIAESKNRPIITTKLAQTKTFVQMSALYYVLLLYILKDVAWIKSVVASAFPVLLDETFIYILMLTVTLLTIYTGIEYIMYNRKILYDISKSRST